MTTSLKSRPAAGGHAVIVAAGAGLRMRSDTRKQYLAVAGKPIVAHTLAVFDRCSDIDTICLVVPGDDLDFCRRQLLVDLGLSTAVTVVAGGERRQDSVACGLAALTAAPDAVAVIHDGVRPFVQPDEISSCIAAAAAHGAAMLAVPVSDTLKRVDADGFAGETIARDHLWHALTPQAFRLSLIRDAHRRALEKGVAATDDAQLVERVGIPVKVVPGRRTNIKITTPEDLQTARALASVSFADA